MGVAWKEKGCTKGLEGAREQALLEGFMKRFENA